MAAWYLVAGSTGWRKHWVEVREVGVAQRLVQVSGADTPRRDNRGGARGERQQWARPAEGWHGVTGGLGEYDIRWAGPFAKAQLEGGMRLRYVGNEVRGRLLGGPRSRYPGQDYPSAEIGCGHCDCSAWYL